MVNQKKKKDLQRLLFVLVVLVLTNIICSLAPLRWDLTAEKRFTLSESTKSILSEVDDVIYFEVFLAGDLPAGFKRLANETERMLLEFRAHNELIDYVITNPSEQETPEAKNALYQQLSEKGLQASTVQVMQGDLKTQQTIFPGIMGRYADKETAINLLVNEQANAEAIINKSIQALEYQLAKAIQKLTTIEKPKVGLIEGHGELDQTLVESFYKEAKEFFTIERYDITRFPLDSLSGLPDLPRQQLRMSYFDALILAKPTQALTKMDQFLIDQYIMNGGKVLWLIDAVNAEMDSLAANNKITSLPYTDPGYDKLLFNYGARVNTNLVMDLESAPILIPESNVGGTPQWALAPWYYLPLARPQGSHPITDNINPVRMEFASSIDTLKVEGVKKTVLLQSSPTARTASTPGLITLDLLLERPQPQFFNKSDLPLAVLLEGTFTSFFKFSLAPKSNSPQPVRVLKESKPTKMIVVSDGDIIRNQMHRGEAVPLGIDKWTYSRTNHVYGNADFLINALDYLIDDSQLMRIRNREVALRLLNKTKVQRDRRYWQVINLALPLAILGLLALVALMYRKKKYAIRYEEK